MVKSRCFLGCEEDKPIYFGFPTSRPKLKKWLSLMNITSKVTNDDVICHQHFATADYECIRGKMRLKKNVVPSLMQEESPTTTNAENISSETIQDKSNTPQPDCEIETEEKPPDVPTQIPPDKPDNNEVETESISKSKTSDVADSATNGPHEQKNKCDSDSSSNVLCSSEDSMQSESNQNRVCQEPDELKEDIEDIITRNYIRNKKPNKLVSPPRQLEPPVPEEPPQVEPVKEPEPVFIEVSVDQDPNSSNHGAGNQDCLMLLESVQVEVDPTTLLFADRDDDDDNDSDVQEVERKEDPISLVTSSDEDEVIIQEPKIDTVEVSSGTDEDDMPLVNLVKTKSVSKKKSNYRSQSNLAKIMWGLCEYYCLHCNFTSSSKSEYSRHLKNHETVLHICQVCGYTTSSKSQFWRHKRKHKDEKRFKCHLCSYRARHSMSLVYHLKSHEGNIGISCKNCGLFFVRSKTAVKHMKSCTGEGKLFPCKVCPYASKRATDLRRHVRARHGDDDTDYIPTYIVFYLPLYSDYISILLVRILREN